MSECDHKFSHMGLQYADGVKPRPGTGATQRYYAHVFFCERCLEYKSKPVAGYENEGSYFNPRDGAVRGDRDIIVPDHDRKQRFG